MKNKMVRDGLVDQCGFDWLDFGCYMLFSFTNKVIECGVYSADLLLQHGYWSGFEFDFLFSILWC